MADIKNPEEVVEETQPQEEARTSSVGTEKVEEPQAQPQEQAPSQEGDVISSQALKPEEAGGRIQKRIEKLEQKLETAKTPEDRQKLLGLINRLKSKLTTYQEIPPELLGNEPLIKPEEYGREIDPYELERRIAQREQATVLKAIQAVESKRKYETALQEHISDFEKVLKEPDVSQDPALREFIENQYRLANFTINPFTGQEDFVPTIKPSEIYQKIKQFLEKKTTQVASQTYGELKQQAETQSVPPSTSKPPIEDLEELRKSLWENPGRVAKELEKRLT